MKARKSEWAFMKSGQYLPYSKRPRSKITQVEHRIEEFISSAHGKQDFLQNISKWEIIYYVHRKRSKRLNLENGTIHTANTN